MDNSLLSLILNPVRMRIIQSLIKNNSMTVQQIAQELTDVPQATLYRHLNKLQKAKVIAVVRENKVRGAMEKVYSMDKNPYEAITTKLDKGNKNEYLNLFYNFLMTLLGDFESYINKNDSDIKKDGVTFRSAAMYLSDEEFNEFFKDLGNALNKIINNAPAPDRKLRKISTIIMPSTDE